MFLNHYLFAIILLSIFLGLKVILDIIPNHSSDQHPWFQLSAKNIEPFADYYIWSNGSIKNGNKIPPNNWVYFSLLLLFL